MQSFVLVVALKKAGYKSGGRGEGAGATSGLLDGGTCMSSPQHPLLNMNGHLCKHSHSHDSSQRTELWYLWEFHQVTQGLFSLASRLIRCNEL